MIDDLAALCWVNPFSPQRAALERRIMGDAYRPLLRKGGRDSFSPNLGRILEFCREQMSHELNHPAYPEVAAFDIQKIKDFICWKKEL